MEQKEISPSGLQNFLKKKMSRKQALKFGALGTAGLLGAGAVSYYLAAPESNHGASIMSASKKMNGDEAWQLWLKRGWAREARHYTTLNDNSVECQLCPNHCILDDGQRGRCHNRQNVGGKFYTMVYGNPCTFHVDPIEKKPLMHFLPATGVFSIATSGCCLRCLNCQNWDISQKSPEETKDPTGPEIRATAEKISSSSFTESDIARMSMFPPDVVELAQHFQCPSIAYTYSEPIVFYEYMQDTAKLAHEKGIKNVCITCGHITPKALEELCPHIDAVNVNLKSFDEKIYHTLNSGQLAPVLDTLKMLKDHGVWFEVTNLVVPTYTDNLDMISKMCDWLVKNIGTDYPLHFSRFHPAHKLTHLPDTPIEILKSAREVAQQAGLKYVYIGNTRELPDVENTFCPKCKKLIVERDIFAVLSMNIQNGKCKFCKEPISGVWKT